MTALGRWLAGVQQKASAVAHLVVMSPGQPQWMPRSYQSFADEAYTRNVIAYQAIHKLATAVADVRWTAWRDDKEVTKSPFLDLLSQPNPMQSQREYVEANVAYFMLSGNRYEERVELRGQPRELYTLRPDRVKVVPGARGMVAAYEFDNNGKKYRWTVDEVSGETDIWHDKTFHPLNDWYGMSPIEAGAYAVDQHNESMTRMQALLQNSMTPSGGLTTDQTLSDDNFKRLKAEIENRYSGAQNAGRPLLLEGGVKWQQMGIMPRDAQLLETKYSSARDICLALGVPPLLMGVPGDNTYANYAEARLAFYEDSVIPMANRLAHDWTRWLGPKFGDLEIRADFDHVPAIVAKQQQLWDMANASTDLTINERRELKGFEPIPGGDVVLVGAAQIPLEDAGMSMGGDGLGDDLSDEDAEAIKSLAYGAEHK